MDKIRFAAQSNTRCQHGCCTISVGVCVCVCVLAIVQSMDWKERAKGLERESSLLFLSSLSLSSLVFSCWKMAP